MRSSLSSLATVLVMAALLGLSACSHVAPKLEPHWAEVNGHAIYYETGGSKTGDPILFLHGGGSSVRGSFRHQFIALGEHHPLIGIEQVGQGHTPDVSGPLTYAGMTEDTATLLTQLKLPPVDAVGFSDGGILALMLAARHPELVHQLVISGANIDPSGLSDEDIAELKADEPGKGISEDESSDDETSADGGDEVPMSEKLRQLWLYSPTGEELSPELLHTIHQHTLVMAGQHDAIRLDHTLLIYHSLPNAKLWIVPHTGHGTFAARPKWVNPAVLAFLDGP